MLKETLDGNEGFPGRDAFFDLMRENGLTLKFKRRKHYKTTYSEHGLRKYPNLIKDVVINRPNQVWVSDITYIETDEGVNYLSLVTDAYSHKILGWALGSSLETIYCEEALKMALETLPKGFNEELIHHSDRGCQYCSYEYIDMLRANEVRISMTQSGDPLENALAERVNGILKTEWIYVKSYPDRKACETDLVNIVAFYNNQRPHMSIGYKTPSVVHQEKGGPQQRCWTNPWNRQKEEKKEENQELNQKTVSILLGIDKKDVNENRFKENCV